MKAVTRTEIYHRTKSFVNLNEFIYGKSWNEIPHPFTFTNETVSASLSKSLNLRENSAGLHAIFDSELDIQSS